ncbi:MAG: c-type cytochrome [Planctomycetes bacterium]|nr:c-type cytochrome [Planctomycetota bacterium]
MSEPVSNPTPKKVPSVLIYAAVILITASWIPLALIAKARTTKSSSPRIHIFQDMDNQPKFKAQSENPLFADRRAMRDPVAGTVAAGELHEDDHLYRGYETDGNLKPVMANGDRKWFHGLPDSMKLDMALLKRGQERYTIYCSVCHGLDGYGDGMVARRAAALAAMQPSQAPGWVPPRDLNTVDQKTGGPMYAEPLYPAGKLFAVISEGLSTMPSYASQIPVEDRWAIVAYVHALQMSQNIPVTDLPADLKDAKFKDAPVVEVPKETGPKLTGDALVAKGKELFYKNPLKPCSVCHMPAAAGVPTPCPSFEHGIFGKKEKVVVNGGAPQEITIDEAYLHESIANPPAKIVVNEATGQPYPPLMVLAGPPLTDDEIEALIAFIKTLGTESK